MASFDLPPPPPQPRSNAMRWVVGCGLVGLACVLGCGVCGGLFLASIFAVIKSSTPYQLALEQVQHDPQVVAQLGEPIEAGWLATGNLEIKNSDGRADLDFTVTGPRGSADVHTLATLSGGQWKLTKLLVSYGDGKSQELIEQEK